MWFVFKATWEKLAVEKDAVPPPAYKFAVDPASRE